MQVQARQLTSPIDWVSRTSHDYDDRTMDRKSDTLLVQLLMARDEEALRTAIETYGRLIFGVATRILGEASLAEEVAQDTFVALWRRPGVFDPSRGSLQSFLAGVARNKAVDVVRREESLRRTKESLMAEVEATVDQAADLGASTDVEERDAVVTALGKLSPLQREAIVLAYFGGRTYREVAAELGVPEGTAKTRLRDGLIRLRELMTSTKES
jgi:RNA polymerase sigma-70 factor, ECF subfamily